MSLPYRVAVLGFSPFERSALASYFRLATRRSPAYEQAETADDAHFLIIDADHPEAVRTAVLQGRVGDAVFIGAQPPAGADVWMMRPIDPLHVLRELDGKVSALALRRMPAPPAAHEHGSSQVRTVIQPPRPRPTPGRRAGDGPAPPDGGGFVAVARPAAPAGAAAPSAEALLVDDSEIALRFLQSKLRRYGIATECVTTSAKAVDAMARRAFDFVFLDVELGSTSELDGLALCQHLKRQHLAPGGGRPPVVVFVSAHANEVDRARGALAGADGYLGKPLADEALRGLLARYGISLPARPEEAEYL